MNKLLSILIVLVLMNAHTLVILTANAAISSCSASVAPSTISANSSVTLTYTINNSSDQDTRWIKIITPDGLNISSVSSSGWSGSVDASTVSTFTGGTISAGGSQSFSVTVNSGNSQSQASSIVRVSDSSTGDGTTECSGSTGITVSAESVDSTAPNISNITVADITSSAVTITWTTDESSNSTVEYGMSSSYGSIKSDPSQATSHSVTIDNLSANTSYHYKIKSSDGSGNTTESSDNTFTTAKAGLVSSSSSSSSSSSPSSSSPSSSSSSSSSTSSTVVFKPAPPVDTLVPVVTITSDLSKPFEKAPLISGKVSDNNFSCNKDNIAKYFSSRKDCETHASKFGVVKLEYSLDDGANWLRIEGNRSSFEFTPEVLEDGNYKLKIRATDAGGNRGLSKVETLIIDRLPPQVGLGVVSSGAQILKTNQDGQIVTMEDIDQKITLSAIGGPLTIDVIAKLKGQKDKVFSLAKNPDSGLWSGTLSFDKTGVYQLFAKSIDGANNITERELNQVIVLEKGQIISSNEAVKEGEIRVYSYDQASSRFVLWDAKSYRQLNPQQVDPSGSYSLLLPAGRYYLEIKSPGFKNTTSEIFNLTQSTPVNADFSLEEAAGFKIGSFYFSLPDFGFNTLPLNLKTVTGSKSETGIINQELPSFDLRLEGRPFNNLTSRSKPTLITFLNSWSPDAYPQIELLEKINDPYLNVFVILPQESISSVEIFKKRGRYNLSFIADPDGTLVEPLKIKSGPTHVFLNRKGTIEKIKVGVLSDREISESLLN
jgi:hypothetical protein